MRFSAYASLVFGLSGVGCAYRTPVVHVPASVTEAPLESPEITAEDLDARPDAEAIDAAKADATRMLALAPGAPTGEKPGHLRVHVSLGAHSSFYESGGRAMSRDGCAAIGALPLYASTLAGVAHESRTVTVEVTLERAGRTAHGQATVTKRGSLYAPARRRAIAAALDLALARAR